MVPLRKRAGTVPTYMTRSSRTNKRPLGYPALDLSTEPNIRSEANSLSAFAQARAGSSLFVSDPILPEWLHMPGFGGNE
jgi:hypothetical protein